MSAIRIGTVVRHRTLVRWDEYHPMRPAVVTARFLCWRRVRYAAFYHGGSRWFHVRELETTLTPEDQKVVDEVLK